MHAKTTSGASDFDSKIAREKMLKHSGLVIIPTNEPVNLKFVSLHEQPKDPNNYMIPNFLAAFPKELFNTHFIALPFWPRSRWAIIVSHSVEPFSDFGGSYSE